MPSYWMDFFDFDIDPDELSERMTCLEKDCTWYITVDGHSLDEVVLKAYNHFEADHD